MRKPSKGIRSPRSASSSNPKWLIAPALLLVGALVFAFAMRDQSTRRKATTAEAPSDESATFPMPVLLRPDWRPPAASATASVEPEPPPMGLEEARLQALDHAKRSLDLYKQTMVFPLWSRPFDGSTKHLADWNKPFPEGQQFAADPDGGKEIRADVVLDKLFAAPGESITATLTVAYDGGDAVQADAVAGHIVVLDPTTQTFLPAGDVAFTAGTPGTYTASFTPSTFPTLTEKPSEARFVTHVTLGRFFKDISEPFQYAAANVFTVRDIAVDRMNSDGSLEVVLDVHVSYLAPTLVEAVLYDATGNTGIAVYDDFITPTKTGDTTMTITFFGKAIRDRGINGPYSIRALHGHVRVPGAQPPEVFWARPATPVLMTRSYLANTFSDAPYSSPEVEAKIQLYQETIADLQNPPQN